MQAKVLARTTNMDRATWLTFRRMGIGGSDIAAIAGLSSFANALSVYADKIGATQSDEENEAMYWGNVLEPVVADEFARQTGYKVRRHNALLQHPNHDWMLANIDRLVLTPQGKGILECKTANQFASSKWGEEEVPMDYQCQVQWYLGITGLPFAWIAVLIGGQKFVYRAIDRDDDIISYLQQLGQEFWQQVQNREIPAVDGSDQSAKILAELFKDTQPESIDLPAEAMVHINDYQAASAQIKEWETKKNYAANSLRALMGHHEAAVCEDFQLSWKNISTNRFNSSQLKKEDPDTYQRFVNTSESRRFAVKAPK